MLDQTREEIIRKLYLDAAGFGSIKNTLKNVRNVDRTTTEAEVREFIENKIKEKNSSVVTTVLSLMNHNKSIK